MDKVHNKAIILKTIRMHCCFKDINMSLGITIGILLCLTEIKAQYIVLIHNRMLSLKIKAYLCMENGDWE
jgi:hypothetical protein